MILARHSVKIIAYLFVSQIACFATLLPVFQQRAIAKSVTQGFPDSAKGTNTNMSGTWIGTASSTDGFANL